MLFIRIVSAFLVVVGTAGFFLPFWFGSLGERAAEIELPVAQVEDVAVSPDGHLFVALIHAARIQKYTANGEFVLNFPVGSGGGTYCIAIAGDRLYVDVGRRRAIDELDLSGRPIKLDVPRGERTEPGGCELDEAILDVEETFTGLRISFVDDRASLVIKPKYWHYLMWGPFGSWLMAIVGLFLWPEWRRGLLKMINTQRGRSVEAAEELDGERNDWPRILAMATFKPALGSLFAFAFFFTTMGAFSLLGEPGAEEPPALAVASFMSLLGFGLWFTANWGALVSTEIKGWGARISFFLAGGFVCGVVLQVCFDFGSFFGRYFANEPTDMLNLWPDFSVSTLVIVGCIAYVIQLIGLVSEPINRRFFNFFPWPFRQ